MANSTITITFTEDLPIGAKLGIEVGSPYSLFPTPYYAKWVNFRSASSQITVGTPTIYPGERDAINYMASFNLDLAGYGFVVSRAQNVITITKEAPYSFMLINQYYDYLYNEIIPFEKHPSINVNIVNDNSGFFEIEGVSFSQSLVNPCLNVVVNVATSQDVAEILSPVSVVGPVPNNPVSFDVLRGQYIELKIKNSSGSILTQPLLTPPLLSISNFELQINNSPYGATVLVLNQYLIPIGIEYSLDNVAWQSSNSFNGLAIGEYTVYVRDNLGCVVSKNFNISEFGVQNPYFYISKSNSFRFANRITWGDSENYKTDENTLSCEVDVELPYKETQQFQSADIITTQFKSNYATMIASVLKDDGNSDNIPIVKKTNNIGLKDRRDARQYNLGGGKTGVYFISGNVFDYDTNAVVSPYALNGLLPEWAVSGNYVSIGTTFYLIEDILYDEVKNAEVIVFSNIYLDSEINVVVGCVYNRFNYEVYEFTLDMVNYIDKKFKIKLENSDPNFPAITHLSEQIWCKVKHENVLEIRYKNETNTDILYSTGIEHKIRIPYIKQSGKPNEQSEIHKTDTTTILLNADIFEADDFQFEPVTKEIWRKLMIALSHEKVLINGVGYVKNGEFNTDGPLERSNLYVLTASMIKTGNVYNSQTSGNLDFDGTGVEVPGLISTESGYVRY